MKPVTNTNYEGRPEKTLPNFFKVILSGTPQESVIKMTAN